MNKTKLSNNTELNGYLAVLSANGLISYCYPTKGDDDITYGITGKGLKFLEIYSYLDNYVPKRWMGDKKKK
jgi:predicted transcriptional regulator